MSWFPTFLNPWMAALAAGIVIPSLLILYFLKLRRRELAVSSTLLWKKAVQDLQVNAPFQRLRRNLLLLLQLLLLLLLLLALSRPVTHYTPGAGQISVLLIDRSASMATKDPDLKGKTRLDEAKRRAKDLAETLGKNSQAMVIAFDETAEIMQTFTGNVSDLKRQIDAIQQTDKKSKLKMAYQFAEAQTNFNPEQLRVDARTRPQVWLYSDGRVSDSAELSIRGDLKYDKIGSENTPNVAIVAMNAKRNYERPTEVQIFARLANFGTEVVTPDVQLTVDGKVRAVTGTRLVPERWEAQKRDKETIKDSVEFTIEMTTAGVVKVEHMMRENDALAADNTASVVVPPPKNLAVLLVTDGNYFLELAMRSLNLQKPEQMIPLAYEQKKPDNFDVIIFDRYQPKFMPNAGNFVYYGAVPPNTKITGNVPVYVPQAKDKSKVVGVIDWKRDHPILRHLPLGSHAFADPIQLKVPPEAEVLMEGPTGPLMVLYRDRMSTHFVMAFDVGDSTWPLKATFPNFMYNLMQFLAVGSEMDVRPQFEPGANPKIQRGLLQKSAPSANQLVLTGPMDRKVIPIPPEGDIALPSLNRVGVYALDPPVPPFDQIAVNLLDFSESNTVPIAEAPGGIGETLTTSAGRSRLELWWWLVACAALPLLLIEWWVYTRRVHL